MFSPPLLPRRHTGHERSRRRLLFVGARRRPLFRFFLSFFGPFRHLAAIATSQSLSLSFSIDHYRCEHAQVTLFVLSIRLCFGRRWSSESISRMILPTKHSLSILYILLFVTATDIFPCLPSRCNS